jgi:hypothetical protein
MGDSQNASKGIAGKNGSTPLDEPHGVIDPWCD